MIPDDDPVVQAEHRAGHRQVVVARGGAPLEHAAPVVAEKPEGAAGKGGCPALRLELERRQLALQDLQHVAGHLRPGLARAHSAARSRAPCARSIFHGWADMMLQRPRCFGSVALSSQTSQGRCDRRTAASAGSGAGIESLDQQGHWPVAAAAGRTLRQLHVLRTHVVGRREVAPLQRALLPVRLAQGDGELRLHQLLAEVEGVRRLVDAELAEDLLDVGAAHEPLAIEDGDGVAVGEDAEVRDR